MEGPPVVNLRQAGNAGFAAMSLDDDESDESAPSPARPSGGGLIGGVVGRNVGGVAGGVVGGAMGGQVGAAIGGKIGSAAQDAFFSEPNTSPLDISSYRPGGGGGGGGSGQQSGGDETIRLLTEIARGIASVASVGVRTIQRPQGISGLGGKV